MPNIDILKLLAPLIAKLDIDFFALLDSLLDKTNWPEEQQDEALQLARHLIASVHFGGHLAGKDDFAAKIEQYAEMAGMPPAWFDPNSVPQAPQA